MGRRSKSAATTLSPPQPALRAIHQSGETLNGWRGGARLNVGGTWSGRPAQCVPLCFRPTRFAAPSVCCVRLRLPCSRERSPVRDRSRERGWPGLAASGADHDGSAESRSRQRQAARGPSGDAPLIECGFRLPASFPAGSSVSVLPPDVRKAGGALRCSAGSGVGVTGRGGICCPRGSAARTAKRLSRRASGPSP